MRLLHLYPDEYDVLNLSCLPATFGECESEVLDI